MTVREVLRPSSAEQVLAVVLGWTLLMTSISSVYDTPLVRLEILVGSVLVLLWAAWATHELLEAAQQKRYRGRDK